MSPLELTIWDERKIVADISSVVWVNKFEYNPENNFLHATVDRELCLPFDVVQRIEDLGISADGLFIFFPESPQAKYAQHLRYNAQMEAFLHSSGAAVDHAKHQ